jgi:hypothetical protein
VVEKDRVIIETQLDRPLDAAEGQALKVAVERYGLFLGAPAIVRRGPTSLGKTSLLH